MTKRGTIRVRNIKLVGEAVFAQADKKGVQQFYISQGEMAHQKTHSLRRGRRSRQRNCNSKNIRLKKIAVAPITPIAILGENDSYWKTVLC